MDPASPVVREAPARTTTSGYREPMLFGVLRCKHEWLAAMRNGNRGRVTAPAAANAANATATRAHDRYRYRYREFPPATGEGRPT